MERSFPEDQSKSFFTFTPQNKRIPLKQLYQDWLSFDTKLLSEEFRRYGFMGFELQALEDFKKKDPTLKVYTGKVRQMFDHHGVIDMIHSDRLSAFDRPIGTVPFKGMILAAMSAFWFEQLSQHEPEVAHHLLERIDSRTLRVRKLTPIKAEVIVRNYLTGSMARAYENGSRIFCGCILPDHLKNFQKLSEPIITPTSKAEVYAHDENKTPQELIEEGVCSESEWKKISELALKTFAIGTKIYAKKGWILVDTKYEFGRDQNGKIYLIDEVHTPDSSRLWVKNTYFEKIEKNEAPEMFDKENVRRELMSLGFHGQGEVPHVSFKSLIELGLTYLNVYEALTDKELNIEL